ncbi:hypothetical protein GCM10010176_014600 [Nonomuraea spiralis]|nr:hypothetical protein GCM10010176_014600 [Nonomuraea spiralis]
METAVTGMPENMAEKDAWAPTPTDNTVHRCRAPYRRVPPRVVMSVVTTPPNNRT